MAGLLPNTFIIGAAKCGTTSLWLYLDAHPEIAFSANKEPAFFVRPHYRDELGLVRGLFRPAPVRGEASTVYTTHPVNSGVPERIRSLVPDAKLIYMVRDPVDRRSATTSSTSPRESSIVRPEKALTEPESRNIYLAASLLCDSGEAVPRLLRRIEPADPGPGRAPRRPADRPWRGSIGSSASTTASGPPHTDDQVRRTAERRRFIGFGGRLRQTAPRKPPSRWIWRLPPRVAIRVVGRAQAPALGADRAAGPRSRARGRSSCAPQPRSSLAARVHR